MEKGARQLKNRGLRGVGAFLMAACVALALGPGDGLEARPAGGGAMVEIGDGGPPLVALTFDDGPRNSTTGRLLEGLALREAPATFFLVGSRIPGSEELLREMKAAGHQIGIHTYDHVKITELTHQQFDFQVDKTRELLVDALGEGDYWFRPPYGITDSAVSQWADTPLVLWSVDPEDWKDRNTDRIVNSVLGRAKDGDIILMHDIYDSSVDAALRIVDGLRDRGYCFVTVEQLLELRRVQPERGVRYTALAPEAEEKSQWALAD